jgi:hypothetical protein
MSQFAPLIREISGRLCVPQPARSRILLEIAADLDDLYEHYLDRGLAPEEAATRTRATLELSDEALAGLIRIHQPPLRRFLDQLSVQARTVWERVTLVVIALFIVALTVNELLTTRLLITASRFVWPLVALAVVAALVALAKVYTLYLKQDHDLRLLRRGLDSLLFLTVATIVMGFLGLIVELYVTARHIVADYDWISLHFTDFLLRASAVMMVSLVLAIAIAVVWFVLLTKVQSIERAETEVLMKHIGVEKPEPRTANTAVPGFQRSCSALGLRPTKQGGLP